MSRYHENVTWQSPETGTWHQGFYAVAHEGPVEDGDEWEVEFDTSRFETVLSASTQAGLDAALDRAGLPNPGGSWISTEPAEVATLDLMAGELA